MRGKIKKLNAVPLSSASRQRSASPPTNEKSDPETPWEVTWDPIPETRGMRPLPAPSRFSGSNAPNKLRRQLCVCFIYVGMFSFMALFLLLVTNAATPDIFHLEWFLGRGDADESPHQTAQRLEIGSIADIEKDRNSKGNSGMREIPNYDTELEGARTFNSEVSGKVNPAQNLLIEENAQSTRRLEPGFRGGDVNVKLPSEVGKDIDLRPQKEAFPGEVGAWANDDANWKQQSFGGLETNKRNGGMTIMERVEAATKKSKEGFLSHGTHWGDFVSDKKDDFLSGRRATDAEDNPLQTRGSHSDDRQDANADGGSIGSDPGMSSESALDQVKSSVNLAASEILQGQGMYKLPHKSEMVDGDVGQTVPDDMRWQENAKSDPESVAAETKGGASQLTVDGSGSDDDAEGVPQLDEPDRKPWKHMEKEAVSNGEAQRSELEGDLELEKDEEADVEEPLQSEASGTGFRTHGTAHSALEFAGNVKEDEQKEGQPLSTAQGGNFTEAGAEGDDGSTPSTASGTQEKGEEGSEGETVAIQAQRIGDDVERVGTRAEHEKGAVKKVGPQAQREEDDVENVATRVELDEDKAGMAGKWAEREDGEVEKAATWVRHEVDGVSKAGAQAQHKEVEVGKAGTMAQRNDEEEEQGGEGSEMKGTRGRKAAADNGVIDKLRGNTMLQGSARAAGKPAGSAWSSKQQNPWSDANGRKQNVSSGPAAGEVGDAGDLAQPGEMSSEAAASARGNLAEDTETQGPDPKADAYMPTKDEGSLELDLVLSTASQKAPKNTTREDKRGTVRIYDAVRSSEGLTEQQGLAGAEKGKRKQQGDNLTLPGSQIEMTGPGLQELRATDGNPTLSLEDASKMLDESSRTTTSENAASESLASIGKSIHSLATAADHTRPEDSVLNSNASLDDLASPTSTMQGQGTGFAGNEGRIKKQPQDIMISGQAGKVVTPVLHHEARPLPINGSKQLQKKIGMSKHKKARGKGKLRGDS